MLHTHGCSLCPSCLLWAVRGGHIRLLTWLLSIGMRPTRVPMDDDATWPVRSLMLWDDHQLQLTSFSMQRLQTARATVGTMHGLIRWCRKQLTASSTIRLCGDSPHPFCSYSSSGQQLLKHMARLPDDVIVKIAAAADLQHDQPVPASASACLLQQ